MEQHKINIYASQNAETIETLVRHTSTQHELDA